MASNGKDSPGSKSDAAPAAPAPVSWSARGGRRGRQPLKLLAALRGSGTLVWPGGSIDAAYELDIFGSGEARSASGNLEGDFAAVPAPDPDEPDAAPITGARLRLDGGHEIAIEITALEPDFVEFEAQLTAADSALLPATPKV